LHVVGLGSTPIGFRARDAASATPPVVAESRSWLPALALAAGIALITLAAWRLRASRAR
jgi:cyanate permease